MGLVLNFSHNRLAPPELWEARRLDTLRIDANSFVFQAAKASAEKLLNAHRPKWAGASFI